MSVTDLCHEYGFSRPTAYKWVKRYEEIGLEEMDEDVHRVFF
jgi:transposase